MWPMVKCQQCAFNVFDGVENECVCLCVYALGFELRMQCSHIGLLHDHKLCVCHTMDLKPLHGSKMVYLKCISSEPIYRISQIAIYMQHECHFSSSPSIRFFRTNMSVLVNEKCPLVCLLSFKLHKSNRIQRHKQSDCHSFDLRVWRLLLFGCNRFNATVFSAAFIIKIINLRLQRKRLCFRSTPKIRSSGGYAARQIKLKLEKSLSC